MINVRQIKDNLTLEQYEIIFEELEIPVVSRSLDVWMLKSMCHSISANDCDANLAFYIDGCTFTCFSHNCIVGGDIFELVQIRQKLFNPSYTFIDAVNFVLDSLGLNSDNYKVKDVNKSWQRIVSKYKHDSIDINTDIDIYDDSILSKFPQYYYQGWIDEGISIDTMSKYEICFYPTKRCIVIPCRDKDDNLIGIRGRFFDDNGKYRPLKLLDGTMYNFPISMFMYGEYQNFQAISQKKKVILVEGEKSVLKSDTWYGKNSIALALYGKNLSGVKIKTLLSMGADEVILGLDYDYHKIGDKESLAYKDNIIKIAKSIKPYFKVSVLFNNKFEGYKYSPFDFTKEQFEYLYNNKITLRGQI